MAIVNLLYSLRGLGPVQSPERIAKQATARSVARSERDASAANGEDMRLRSCEDVQPVCATELNCARAFFIAAKLGARPTLKSSGFSARRSFTISIFGTLFTLHSSTAASSTIWLKLPDANSRGPYANTTPKLLASVAPSLRHASAFICCRPNWPALGLIRPPEN